MKIRYWILIIILILLVTFTILYKNYKEDIVVGGLDEEIKIDMEDLKECCNYYENRKLKTCSILERFECSLCESKCSS